MVDGGDADHAVHLALPTLVLDPVPGQDTALTVSDEICLLCAYNVGGRREISEGLGKMVFCFSFLQHKQNALMSLLCFVYDDLPVASNTFSAKSPTSFALSTAGAIAPTIGSNFFQ